MAQTQYEIIKELYRFPDVPGREWHKELNLISWYGKEPCFDLRMWKNDHEKIGKKGDFGSMWRVEESHL